MNEPHYLQKISYKIHDNFSFEPDAETNEKLVQQFIDSIMGTDADLRTMAASDVKMDEDGN